MHKNIMTEKRFWPHFVTQFLGAFNDNLFKNALVILITFRAYAVGGISPEQMVALCSGIFILPFFLFSAVAGQMADKYSKSRLIFWIKVWEILVMLLGAVGFISGNVLVLMGVLFLMGLQSAFFGPVKYSILPQLLSEDELVAGNAYVETGTFVSILLGTIAGGVLIAIPGSGAWLVSLSVMGVAAAGCLASLKIMRLEPSAPDLRVSRNPVSPTLEILNITRQTRSVFLSILGISWFWFLGAAILSLLPPYCKNVLNADASAVTFFLALFSVGVGVGSILCERLSFQKLELGLVPIGSIGISIFAFDLFLSGAPGASGAAPAELINVAGLLSTWHGWRISLDFFLFSLFGGFFIVPLYTLIQQRAKHAERSRVIAGNNILNALFIVVSALFLVGLFSLDLTIPQIFLVLSLLNVGAAVYIYTIVPEFLFRFLCWILANLMYRLKVAGRENIPLEGPAVMVCNHVTFIDWLIVASACQRPVRFVMHYTFLKIPLTGRIFRDAKVIPIAGARENRYALTEAFDRISRELEEGEIVCIFPEGKLTPDGSIGAFRSGIERIIRRNPVPVIPMALTGMWGSFFSRKHGKAMTKPFRRFWSRVRLTIGAPVPPEEATAALLHEEVTRLASDPGSPAEAQTPPGVSESSDAVSG